MFWKETHEGVVISLKITPKSSKSEAAGIEGDELKLRIAAVPEKGEANAEIIRFLSKRLKISKSKIILISGETSRHKRVLIKGVEPAALKTLSNE
jgi:uncharacterized protein (TIGR00251 family)